MSSHDCVELIDSSDSDERTFVIETRRATVRRSKRQRRTAVKPIYCDDEVELSEEDEEYESSLLERLRQRKTGYSKADIVDDNDDDAEEKKENDDMDLLYAPRVSESPPSKEKITSLRRKITRATPDTSSYLKTLQANVRKRTFPLSQIPNQRVSTGRTIKKLNAWKGHWPPLREFLQNTIDHLNLMDGKTGRRQACVDLHVDRTRNNDNDLLTTFTFTCENQQVCKIKVARDEVTIDQLYTYPIASRALDTGVPDTTKSSSNSNQAGGFGDGFKTATVALIANAKKRDFTKLKWDFYALEEETKIEWEFEGLTRESVATFAKCEVLQVNIKKTTIDMNEWNQLFPSHDTEGTEEEEKNRNSNGHKYIMRQVIQVKGIGKAFIEQTVPRLVVFWDLDEESLISMSKSARGGDFICHASSQPTLSDGLLGSSLRPLSGVYVRGIWVRPAKIKDTIMCFFGNRLEVIGRDRNEVDEDALIDAIVYVLKRCKNLQYLKKLLEPLRGQMELFTESCSSTCTATTSIRARSYGNTTRTNTSWLLQSPRFFNRVIELQKDFILYDVFNIPRGAIFVSSKTTSSKDPFINWAAAFLKKNGAPLIPIETGANKYLFEEVNEFDLSDRCVKIILRKLKDCKRGKSNHDNKIARPFFRKLFSFMGIRRTEAFFSPDIAVAFVHNSNIFIPEATLTRDLIVRVLNVCNTYLGGADAECYSCLLQAVFETLPAKVANITIELVDATKVVDRAKDVQKEARGFLKNPSAATDVAEEKCSSSKRVTQIDMTSDSAIEVDLTSNDEENDEELIGGNDDPMEEDMIPKSRDDLEQQIKRVSQIASNQTENSIIPEADFPDDAAGHDCCLRKSSTLKKVAVDATLGGGHIYCDNTSATAIKNREWSNEKQRKVFALRGILKEASNMVRQSIPSLTTLLGRVHAGYDGDNNTYEAFCDGERVIVNLFANMFKLAGNALNPPYPRSLVHDFVVLITHELAHFLEPRAGHGPVWRDTHMKMVIEVMTRLEK